MADLPLFAKTVGRRKTAVANLKLVPGLGHVNVNGYSVTEFFLGHLTRFQRTQKPFHMLTRQMFDVDVRVRGGGIQRKADAFQLALARALVRMRPDTKHLFREYSLLTCDSRKKERRKYGLKKARKAKQFSKRLYNFYLVILYFFMSQVTEEILEKLKTLTLIEAVELVSQIEKTFSVDASISGGGVVTISAASGVDSEVKVESEKATFDVVLESIDSDKRVAVLKAVRALTNLGLKEAKDFCSSLPKVVKEGVSKDDAEAVKRDLEKSGSKVTIK